VNTQHTQPTPTAPELMLRRVGGVLWQITAATVKVVLSLTVVFLFLIVLILPRHPCACQGQMTRVMADINSIEAGLTEILSDSEVLRLEDVFNPVGVAEFMLALEGVTHWPPQTPAEFEAATALYTTALYGVLRSGSRVSGFNESLRYPTEADAREFAYDRLFKAEVLASLSATGYVRDLSADPWGNLYNIHPGPWKTEDAFGVPVPTPFRVYLKPENEDPSSPFIADSLTLEVLNYDSKPITVGWPAQRNRLAFIWSNGANLESSQANYLASPEQFASAGLYSDDQDPEFWGGGDDINNWDPSNSFALFY